MEHSLGAFEYPTRVNRQTATQRSQIVMSIRLDHRLLLFALLSARHEIREWFKKRRAVVYVVRVRRTGYASPGVSGSLRVYVSISRHARSHQFSIVVNRTEVVERVHLHHRLRPSGHRRRTQHTQHGDPLPGHFFARSTGRFVVVRRRVVECFAIIINKYS